MTFHQNLNQISSLVEKKMKELLPSVSSEKDRKLVDAMSYSSLSSGKRLRPFLTFISASLFGVSQESALRAASAIEFVHAYSIIHDDLPAMDDDDERRGQPSCHIKFGEAAAILAGDALLTLAFEIMSDKDTHPDSNVRCDLVSALAKAIGCHGMVGGQMLDVLSEESEFSVNEIMRMQRMKTGELFAVACETGAILGKSSKNLRNSLRNYAHSLGLAFQITDDIMDNTSDNQENGKIYKKTNVDNIGIENSQEQAKMLISQAISHLHVFEEKADPLRELARFVLERNR
ncbi:Farnesyl diphosphate synthase [Candidatus Arcanobacter lacustris]|uniref:Farnesyl diphosphate synthase n=1 Tax=Candidatus Arcanibacter lacustris TaxID=1607817 RepID=A0A0F5MNM6_9RICK|nr:Farnesyl diphosphate synthase [Candidatus Arcanobacter lacustris]